MRYIPSSIRVLIVCLTLLWGISMSAQGQNQHRQVTTGHGTLKVMTYNILHGAAPGLRKTSDPVDLSKVAAVIKSQQPDIVAIQEVDSLWDRSDNQDQTKELAALTGLHYYHYSDSHSFTDTAGWGYGIGILSRYPLKDTQTVFLTHNDHPGSEIWVNSVATLTLPSGQDIRFICAHYDYLYEDNRILEAAQTSQMADTSAIAVILAGDLNARPGSQPINLLEKSFDRSCSNCAVSFPSHKPCVKLDYIMAGKKARFKVEKSGVLNNEAARFASDHLPYLVQYSW